MYLYAIHDPEFGPHGHKTSLQEDRYTAALIHPSSKAAEITWEQAVSKEATSTIFKASTYSCGEWSDILWGSLRGGATMLNSTLYNYCGMLLHSHTDEDFLLKWNTVYYFSLQKYGLPKWPTALACN